jgi:hypothetical protein
LFFDWGGDYTLMEVIKEGGRVTVVAETSDEEQQTHGHERL